MVILASVLIVTCYIYYTDLQFSPNVYFHSVSQTFTVFTEYGESLHLKITSSLLILFFKMWKMINNEKIYIYIYLYRMVHAYNS